MNVTVRSARTAQPEHVTAVGLQPGRDVDGDDGTARGVDGLDAGRRQPGDVAREARAEDRIDDDLARCERPPAANGSQLPPAATNSSCARRASPRRLRGIGDGDDVSR